MTVYELVQKLIGMPPNAEIVVAVNEVEERYFQVEDVASSLYDKQMVLVLKPESEAYYDIT